MLCREISRCEVSNHCSPDDCWLIIRNTVYDVTPFFEAHPGGMEMLLEYAGSDATDAFESCGHSMSARMMMDRFQIGTLPAHQHSDHADEYVAHAKKVMCSLIA